jgi:UTP:GlnB (protein PII) uridylyltransferase
VEELDSRRKLTSLQIRDLQATLGEAERLAAGKACVYATGSFGRGEASRNSDLDLLS